MLSPVTEILVVLQKNMLFTKISENKDLLQLSVATQSLGVNYVIEENVYIGSNVNI